MTYTPADTPPYTPFYFEGFLLRGRGLVASADWNVRQGYCCRETSEMRRNQEGTCIHQKCNSQDLRNPPCFPKADDDVDQSPLHSDGQIHHRTVIQLAVSWNNLMSLGVSLLSCRISVLPVKQHCQSHYQRISSNSTKWWHPPLKNNSEQRLQQRMIQDWASLGSHKTQ